jgi:predicted type IV restriction endonuclease
LPPDIRRELKRVAPVLLEAQKENLNEADTTHRLNEVFERVLGYDALREISFEAQLKGKYVDVVLKVEGRIRVLVEVKAAGVILRDRHIEQAQLYASQNNFQWVLLTNGITWNLYHLTFDEGIEYERAFSVDLTTDPVEKVAEALSVLHRDAVKQGDLEEYWQRRAVLSPASIGKALFTEDVLRHLRREVRRQEGVLVDVEDLAAALRSMFTPEARELIGPAKIRKRRARAPTEAKAVASGPGEPAPGA